jgi:hypothetical protein
MPWFADFLTALSHRKRRSPRPLARRIVAAALSASLALGTVSPAAALASEADSEGEGAAAPGAIEGGPEDEEETALEEVPGSVVDGDSEESGEGPPVEAEPQRESELPAVSGAEEDEEEVNGAATEALPEVVQPPAAEAPSATESGPAYEPALAPPPIQPVENQPLSAPPSPVAESEPPPPPRVKQLAPQPSPPPEPAAPSDEEPPPPRPAAVPAERQAPRSGIAGGDFHTVRSGESLWSIAAALLPAGAGNAEIAAEVKRLWRLNASRIGTGDPNLLMVGTRLRLPR